MTAAKDWCTMPMSIVDADFDVMHVAFTGTIMRPAAW
jgi:hypothetical protein